MTHLNAIERYIPRVLFRCGTGKRKQQLLCFRDTDPWNTPFKRISNDSFSETERLWDDNHMPTFHAGTLKGNMIIEHRDLKRACLAHSRMLIPQPDFAVWKLLLITSKNGFRRGLQSEYITILQF